jgi:hypothetical protein
MTDGLVGKTHHRFFFASSFAEGVKSFRVNETPSEENLPMGANKVAVTRCR